MVRTAKDRKEMQEPVLFMGGGDTLSLVVMLNGMLAGTLERGGTVF